MRSVFCALIILLLIFNSQNVSGHMNSNYFSLLSPSLTPLSLNAVFFINNKMGWTGGRKVLFHTTDGGETWLNQAPPDISWIKSIFFINDSVGWAVGNGNRQPYMIHTKNAGVEWKKVVLKNSNATSYLKIYFMNELNGILLSSSGYHLTTDGGTTWSPAIMSDKKFEDVSFIDSKSGCITGEDFIGYTDDGGKTFHKSDSIPAIPGNYHRIQMIDTNIAYCLGWFCIIKTIDGGKNWQLLPITPQGTTPHGGPRFEQIYFANRDTGFAYWGFSPVNRFKTTDGGKNWIISPVETKASTICDFNMKTNNTGIAVTINGGVYSIDESGNIKDEYTKGTGPGNYSLDFVDSENGFIGTFNESENKLLYTSDGGKGWKTILTPLKSIGKICSFSKSIIVIHGGIGADPFTFKSINGGITWEQETVFSSWHTSKKIGKDNNMAFVYCRRPEKLLVTEDCAASWCEKTLPYTGLNNIDIFFLDNKTAWACNIGVVKSEDGGNTWNKIIDTLPETPMGIGSIYFYNKTLGFIGGNKQVSDTDEKAIILKTVDGGKTWKSIQNIVYVLNRSTPYIDDNNSTGSNIKDFYSEDGKQFWALDQDGILFSQDSGESWSEVLLPNKATRLYNACFINSGNFYVAGLNKSLWRYMDPAYPDNLKVEDNFKLSKISNNNHFSDYFFDLKGRRVQINSNMYTGNQRVGSGIIIGIKKEKIAKSVFMR